MDADKRLERALGEILEGIAPLPLGPRPVHHPDSARPAKPPKAPKTSKRRREPDPNLDPEAWDRYRTCERKKAYPTETAARLDALRQRRQLFVYRCRFCEKFHLTSQGGSQG